MNYTFDHPIPTPSRSLYARYADELETMPVGASIFIPINSKATWTRVIQLLFSRRPYLTIPSAGHFRCRAATESNCKGTRVWKLKSLPTRNVAGPTQETSTSPSETPSSRSH